MTPLSTRFFDFLKPLCLLLLLLPHKFQWTFTALRIRLKSVVGSLCRNFLDHDSDGLMHQMIVDEEVLTVINSRRCHIIVGGGSSGIMLCNQLLEKDDVILVERGSKNPYSSSTSTQIPSLWPVAAVYDGEGSRACTMPQKALGQRLVMYPQGSGIGGTSNINAMIWSAGHPAVFDNYWHRKWNSDAIQRFELK